MKLGKRGKGADMTITAGARNFLIGLILILFAVAGCGNGSESELPKQPAVLRKQIAMPKKQPPKAVKPEEMVAKKEVPESKEQPPQAVKPEERVAKEEVLESKDQAPKVVKPEEMVAKKEVPETKEQPPQAVKPEEGEAEERVAETKTATQPPLQQAKAEPPMPEKKPMVQRASPKPTAEQTGEQPLYSAKGKIDPFQPLFATESQHEEPAGEGRKKQKRPPLTPLQRLDLGQLKLVGIIVSPSGNKAIVEEPSGKGYVITVGTYIGRNFGRVKQILNDRVIVEEQAGGFAWDELIPQTTELRLEKRSGNV